MKLGSELVDSALDVRHTGLVSDEGGKMGVLGGIVAGELSNSSAVVLAALSRKETERSVTGSFELAMRHVVDVDNSVLRV